jgi:AAA family ATP:ADP antiporter
MTFHSLLVISCNVVSRRAAPKEGAAIGYYTAIYVAGLKVHWQRNRHQQSTTNIDMQPQPTLVGRWLTALTNVDKSELRALGWSFVYFFTLLCSYYIIRPLRDEMGIAGGVENLQWLFTGTFLVMLAAVPLFGWVASRYPRHRFLPYVYLFFVVNLLIFFVLFRSGITHAYVARAFFIWASVYNLFVVSVFWSFMVDIFNSEQAKRLFGLIAAGGTAGALCGPILTTTLATQVGPTNLLLISAGLLVVSILSVNRLSAWRRSTMTGLQKVADSPTPSDADDQAMGGSIIAAFRLVLTSPYLLGICLMMLLYTTLATFIYFQQAHIIADHFSDSAQRTTVFAAIDLAVNVLTISFQLFLTGRIVKYLGLAWTLAFIPVALALGFLVLGLAPAFAVLVIVQVLRRAGNYAIMRPAREMLFSVLTKEEKYKAKNFIDTAVYRGGDAMSAWTYAGLSGLGFSLSAIAFIAAPLCVAWAWVAYTLGRKREAMSQHSSDQGVVPLGRGKNYDLA